jgi:hypothetical protein
MHERGAYSQTLCICFSRLDSTVPTYVRALVIALGLLTIWRSAVMMGFKVRALFPWLDKESDPSKAVLKGKEDMAEPIRKAITNNGESSEGGSDL